MPHTIHPLGLLVGLLSACVPALPAQDEPPPVTRVMRRMDLPVQFGPTGVSGYVFRNQLVVTAVVADSPANGRVEPGDLIHGVGGRDFAPDADPRKALGKVVTAVESQGGELELRILRGTQKLRPKIRLRAMGSYDKSWTKGRAKMDRVFREAVAYLIHNQQRALIQTNHVARCSNGLLLLASDDPAALEVVRRAVYRVVEDPLTSGYTGWSRGYSGILLAEYYLKTGDKVVLPKLRELARSIPAGQMACGSWGHRMPWDGYGAVNQIGLACYLAMVLFEECGVDVDDEAMQVSTRFFKSYAGKGWIPYGDHVPYQGRSDAGKNGIAAVALDVLGGHEVEVRDFARSTAASFEHREVGHTGAYFSYLWGPVGAARAPAVEYDRFMAEQTWYYDLARDHEGGIVCQPNPENLTGRTPGTYTQWGAVGTTGAMALHFAWPRQSLRIFRAGQKGAATTKVTTAQIDAAALAAIEKDIEKGDHFMASARLDALRQSGAKMSPKLRGLVQAVLAAAEAARHGEEFYRHAHRAARQSRSYAALRRLADQGRGYYPARARALLKGIAQPRRGGGAWRSLGDTRAKAGFAGAGDARALRILASSDAGAKLFLNGQLIAEFGEEVGRRQPQEVELPAAVLGVLKERGNKLRLEGGKRRNKVELQVRGGRR